MVFSRCAIFLRVADKKTLLRNFLEPKDREIGFLKKTQNYRFYRTEESEKFNESSVKNESLEPTFFGENVRNNEYLSSNPASRFVPCVENARKRVEEFDKDYLDSENPESDFFNEIELPKALDKCDEDVSHIAPFYKPSFNFAAYANNSRLVQELAKLGVDLHQVEKRPYALGILLRHNFDDLKPYVQFLHDCGVTADDIGPFLTINPNIFTQDIDDLHTRIRYLRAHKFDADSVARIVKNNPFWLMFSTQRIDNRLGFFQREYQLNGNDVRYLATKQPKLITYGHAKLREMNFAVREEMGFNKSEIKSIILAKPRVFMRDRKKLVDLFDYVHNTMKLPHEMIARQPKILTCRLERLRQRHNYLKILDRAQYDPESPMYVSAEALISGTDVDFCQNVAKTTVQTYNMYLKTL